MRILMRLTIASLLAILGVGCNTQNGKQRSQTKLVNAADLKPNEIQHERLSEGQLGRIKKLQETFAEVDKSSLEKWIDNFKRDANPDAEIAIWERVARAYRSYCAGRELTLEAKDDVLQSLLMRSMTSDEEAVRRLKLKVLSEDETRKYLGSCMFV